MRFDVDAAAILKKIPREVRTLGFTSIKGPLVFVFHTEKKNNKKFLNESVIFILISFGNIANKLYIDSMHKKYANDGNLRKTISIPVYVYNHKREEKQVSVH